MIGEALRAIDGISDYPSVSLVLFFVSFIVVVVVVLRMDSRLVRHAGRLPLDDDGRENRDGGIDNE